MSGAYHVKRDRAGGSLYRNSMHLHLAKDEAAKVDVGGSLIWSVVMIACEPTRAT
jgi:hypothetical protein